MHTEPSAIIYIVDDEPHVCRALERLLRSGSYQTRAFVSGVDFLSRHDPDRPGCVILDFDFSVPGLDGLKVQSMLAASGCLRPVIFLTGRANIATSVAALRSGAVDFLTKPVDAEALFCAVREALEIDALTRRAAVFLKSVSQRHATLTPREREVLEQVVRGRLNKQIAADLGTVEKTIKVHRSRVMTKMGARSLAELVQIANSIGIGTAPIREWGGERRTIERVRNRLHRLALGNTGHVAAVG
jgi:FixJ family two-component response regulator